MKQSHDIPLNSVVEILEYDWDRDEYVSKSYGLRLIVMKHTWDCDGTPLYSLGLMTAEQYEAELEFLSTLSVVLPDGVRASGGVFASIALSGYTEDSLKVHGVYEDD